LTRIRNGSSRPTTTEFTLLSIPAVSLPPLLKMPYMKNQQAEPLKLPLNSHIMQTHTKEACLVSLAVLGEVFFLLALTNRGAQISQDGLLVKEHTR